LLIGEQRMLLLLLRLVGSKMTFGEPIIYKILGP